MIILLFLIEYSVKPLQYRPRRSSEIYPLKKAVIKNQVKNIILFCTLGTFLRGEKRREERFLAVFCTEPRKRSCVQNKINPFQVEHKINLVIVELCHQMEKFCILSVRCCQVLYNIYTLFFLLFFFLEFNAVLKK